jgi:hypothetical protein
MIRKVYKVSHVLSKGGKEAKDSKPGSTINIMHGFLISFTTMCSLWIRLSYRQSTISPNAYINSQNTCICATENPHTLYDGPLHAQKIGVWCALSRMGNVGPPYFESSVDSAVYRDLVQQFVPLF